MSDFQEKLKDILSLSNAFKNAKYIGRTAYISIEKEIKVKAELITFNATDSFEGIRLTVMNNNCVIDNLIIRFDDYFAPQDLFNGTKAVPHIWIHKDKVEWYVYPDYDGFKSIARAVDDYVSIFTSNQTPHKRKGMQI